MVNNICAVSCCGKESYPGCGLSFHSLPSDLELKKKWLEVIPGNLHQSSVVCSLHFNREDYRTEARKKLKPGVIPSIFPKPSTGPDESDLQKEIKQDENIPEKTPRAKKVLLTVESSRGITLIKAQPVPSTSSTSAVPLVSLEEQIQVKKLEEKCDSLKRKVKTLNEKVRRQKKKIENFENVIKDLQEKIL